MFDCYHTQIMQGDLTRRLKDHLDLIGHVQIAAVPSRAEPDEGEIDYRDICRTLDRLGYDGWIGAEYKPRGRTEDGLGWLSAWSRTIDRSPGRCSMRLGCIADDLTGATDLALMLAREGLRTIQTIGVPRRRVSTSPVPMPSSSR